MKTAEEYKKEFLKRASTGYLLKLWRSNYGCYYDYITCEYLSNKIIVEDIIWSRESGTKKYHTWTSDEFRVILSSRPHIQRKKDAKSKRQLLASKYKHGRLSHKK